MYYKKYQFYEKSVPPDVTYVSMEALYTPEIGYGFVTEENRNLYHALQISELNAGFEPYYWFAGEALTKLCRSDHGVCLAKGTKLPLIFKADVPRTGNYHITVTITAGAEEINNILLFAGRRRLIAKKDLLSPYQSFTASATINICDIIPRGKTKRFKDTSFDLTVLADAPVISEVIIEEADCPTLYIAGDSTVTDQNCAYPYDPGNSYSGWGQMLSYYLKPGIAISNHSHSGLTTESFRSEGHYAIIEEQIKPGDYFFLQFAHNDQKLSHLSATGGYTDNIIRYIKELRAKSVIPIIVTPLARNTWKGDGSYNDLLKDFSNACIQIGREYDVPVIDLHAMSMSFVKQEGLENAARYYFPKDYTHSNDYGAYLMAGYVASECEKLPILGCYITNRLSSQNDGNSEENSKWLITDWLPPEKIIQPTPPPEFQSSSPNTFPVNFIDIDVSPNKPSILALTKAGIIPNTESIFRGTDIITRVEALDWIVRGVRFVPMNVYNDRYPDVIGHEWYAGLVETVYQNEIVNEALTSDGYFHPLQAVTEQQLVSFLIASYKCRRLLKDKLPDFCILNVNSWAVNDINAAKWLNLIPDHFDPQKELTREAATEYVNKLINIL